VDLVLAAAVTELLELETASGRLLVLGRRVVPLLALGALQCDDFPHLKFLPCFRDQRSVFLPIHDLQSQSGYAKTDL
jgi:hypothetical protein